jgi:hypothetical protein
MAPRISSARKSPAFHQPNVTELNEMNPEQTIRAVGKRPELN